MLLSQITEDFSTVDNKVNSRLNTMSEKMRTKKIEFY